MMEVYLLGSSRNRELADVVVFLFFFFFFFLLPGLYYPSIKLRIGLTSRKSKQQLMIYTVAGQYLEL